MATSPDDAPAVGADELPERLREFLERNGVPTDVYAAGARMLRRYLRVEHASCSAPLLRSLFASGARPCCWCPFFCTMPYDTGVQQLPERRSSAVQAVLALDPRPGEHVLDLCAAPCCKLGLASSVMQMRAGRGAKAVGGGGSGHESEKNAMHGSAGSVTGVDVRRDRLQSGLQLLKHAGLLHPASAVQCRLYVGDARRFTLPPPTGACEEHAAFDLLVDSADTADPLVLPSRKRRNRAERSALAARKRTRRMAQGLPAEPDRDAGGSSGAEQVAPSVVPSPPRLYDKVLVDAPCTHDGSVRHMLKSRDGGWGSLETQILSDSYLKDLNALQRELILHGFRLLKPGGTLVYSTCSLAKAQNEDVVRWLLDQCHDAQLARVVDESGEFPGCADLQAEWDSQLSAAGPPPGGAEEKEGEHPSRLRRVPITAGHLEGTVRFVPSVSGTSGLFVASIRKV